MVSPIQTSPKVNITIIGSAIRNTKRFIGTWIMKPSMKVIAPWISASVLFPSIFPRNIELLDIGATSISFRKPNSLSQITETPMNIDVKSIVWAMIPG
jgi:hypothetical protein